MKDWCGSFKSSSRRLKSIKAALEFMFCFPQGPKEILDSTEACGVWRLRRPVWSSKRTNHSAATVLVLWMAPWGPWQCLAVIQSGFILRCIHSLAVSFHTNTPDVRNSRIVRPSLPVDQMLLFLGFDWGLFKCLFLKFSSITYLGKCFQFFSQISFNFSLFSLVFYHCQRDNGAWRLT